MRLLAIGTSCLDVLVHPLSKLPAAGGRAMLSGQRVSPAGNALSAARCARRLGASAGLLTGLGADSAGALISQYLSKERVQLFRAAEAHPETSLSIVAVSNNGERRIISCLGANASLTQHDMVRAIRAFRPDTILLCGLVLLDALIAEPPSFPLRRLFSSRVVILDPGFRSDWSARHWARFVLPWAQACSVFAPSADEFRALTGRLLSYAGKAATDLRVTALCIKDGARGCVIAIPDSPPVRIPSVRVSALDTTGAGDCWTAGLGVALRGNRHPSLSSLVRAAQFANAAGAEAVRGLGAVPVNFSARSVRRSFRAIRSLR
jgi:ribokinase